MKRSDCDRLLLATGGCRVPALGQLAVSLGHTLEPPVPSLFTFHLETPWVREPGRGFGRDGGGFGAGDGIARARRVAADALGIERSGDSAAVGVGGAGVARFRLPVPASPELAAAPRRGSPRGRAPVAPRFPARAVCGQHAASAADRPPLGTACAGGGHSGRHALGRSFPGRAARSSSNNCSAPNCR